MEEPRNEQEYNEIDIPGLGLFTETVSTYLDVVSDLCSDHVG